MSRLGYTKDVGASESYRDQKLIKTPDRAWTHVTSQLSTIISVLSLSKRTPCCTLPARRDPYLIKFICTAGCRRVSQGEMGESEKGVVGVGELQQAHQMSSHLLRR